MPLLIFIVVLFVAFGWALPPSMWGTVPIVVGILMFLGGLLGIWASFRASGATAGLGAIVFTFFGVVLVVFGLGMAGREDVADLMLGWLRNADDKSVIVGGLIVGFVLAGFANRQN